MGTITITCDIADLKAYLNERDDLSQVCQNTMKEADQQLVRVQDLEAELHSVKGLLWRAKQEAVNTVRSRVSPEDMKELLKANQNRDRLKTIKWVRQLTGLPLKESMVLVDQIAGYVPNHVIHYTAPENKIVYPDLPQCGPLDEIGGTPVKYDGGDIKDDEPAYSNCPAPGPIEVEQTREMTTIAKIKDDEDIPF